MGEREVDWKWLYAEVTSLASERPVGWKDLNVIEARHDERVPDTPPPSPPADVQTRARELARGLCKTWVPETGQHPDGLCEYCERNAPAIAAALQRETQRLEHAWRSAMSTRVGNHWLFNEMVRVGEEMGFSESKLHRGPEPLCADCHPELSDD